MGEHTVPVEIPTRIRICAFVNTSRLQGIYPCSVEKIGAGVPLTTNSGVLLNSLRWDSEWRDRTGFNGHPNLIPAVNLLMQ